VGWVIFALLDPDSGSTDLIDLIRIRIRNIAQFLFTPSTSYLDEEDDGEDVQVTEEAVSS
jgi:hypothetical protein